MNALNQLIAASGERFYENARRGWIERPGEARQRQQEELTLKGLGQQQDLRGLQIEGQRLENANAPGRERDLEQSRSLRDLQIQQTQGQLEDYGANRGLRDAQRKALEDQVSPEYRTQDRDLNNREIESAIRNDKVVMAKLEAETAEIKSKQALKEQEVNDDRAIGIVESLLNQHKGNPAALQEAFANSIQSITDLTGPSVDEMVENLLNGDPNELAGSLSNLVDAFPVSVKLRREIYVAQQKEAAKATRPSSMVTKDIDGVQHRLDPSGQHWIPMLTADGEPATTGAQKRADMDAGHAEKREDRYNNQLDLRVKAEKRKGVKQSITEINTLRDDGKAVIAAVKPMFEAAEEAQVLMEGEMTPPKAKILQRVIASINKSGTKAQSEIESWLPGQSGNLLERLEGKIAGFVEGTFSEAEVNALRRDVKLLQENYINPALKRNLSHIVVNATRRGVPLNEVIPQYILDKIEPKHYSDEDLEFTAKQHGMTVDEVKTRLEDK
ncbi:MAG: hypothetical protein JKY96_04515 [Phycisphaerales bacterium]|nr:hypothetical protein [Phycisphaerales bacterium]